MPALLRSKPPLIAHVIQRLAVGGMENGLVNLINHMPPDRYRHTIICLSETTSYSDRIHRKDVPVIALNQRSGRDGRAHARFFNLLRRLHPEIVHTRNLSALEFQALAALAGVPGKIHGEHGRDMYDLDGTNFKYNVLRKAMRLFIDQYIPVSQDLARWLIECVNVAPSRVTQIYNGVDAEKFHPRSGDRPALGPDGFISPDCFVIGTVGRMEPVKDQLNLVRAFIHLFREQAPLSGRLRLIVIGDGLLRAQSLQLLRDAQAERFAWLPGEMTNIPEIMRSLDLFVLPSLREGISNTILEAMATGLPVVATGVGGNPELVEHEKTGMLVAHSDAIMMAHAIKTYVSNSAKAATHGRAGRTKIEARFSMGSMVDGYCGVYDAVLRSGRKAVQSSV